MLQVALFAIIAFLLIISLTLFFRLQKLQSKPNASQCSTFNAEEIFQTIPLPIIYKKNGNWHSNKAFSHAFGTMSKENSELLVMLPKNGEHTCELQFDNGISKPTLIYTAPLLGASGDFVAIVVDIAHLQKSKALLLQQKERLELALDGCNEALWDWDIKRECVFYSPKWKQLMGYEAKENPSALSSWLNLVHSKDMALVNERLKTHLDGKSEYFEVDHRIRQSDPLQWVNVRGRAILGKNEQPVRMVGMIKDVTQQKAYEVKERLEHDRFIAFVEHLPALSFIKNAHGNYLYLNQAYQQFLGFKAWKNRSATDLFDAHTAHEITEIDRLSLYEGLIQHEITLPTSEGFKHSFYLYQFPIDEEGEKLLCGFCINKPFRE